MLRYRRNFGADPLALVLQRMIERRIEKVTPGERQVMASVASADLINYLILKLGFEDYEDAEEITREYIERIIDEKPAEFLGVTGEWFDVWLWKWRQRVKLVLKEEVEKENTKVDQKVKPIIPKIKYYKELYRYTISSLIRNNEVCFTNLLAENIIKSSIYKFSLSINEPSKIAKLINKNPLVILEDISKRIRSLKRFKGQLVIVRVNPQIFSQSGTPRILREWWF